MSSTNSTSSVNNGSNANNNRSVDRRTRPDGSPKANKDFGKVLGKKKDDDRDDDKTSDVEEGEEVGDATDTSVAEGKRQRPASLFDLTATKKAPEQMIAQAPMMAKALPPRVPTAPGSNQNPDAEVASDDKVSDDSDSDSGLLVSNNSKLAGGSSDSLAAISGQNKNSGDGSSASDSDASDSEDSPSFASKQQEAQAVADQTSAALSKQSVKAMDKEGSASVADEKIKEVSRYSTEQTDLSYINLQGANQQIVASENVTAAAKAPPPTSNIQEIINQLVEKMYEVKQDGETDTVVVLKQPPMFAGANIILTSHENAPGEFNLSFQNLSQMAKNILDMRVNQDSLKSGLEQKGYMIHIITTMTEIEKPIIAEQSQQGHHPNRDQDGQQGQQGQHRRRNPYEADEEEV